MNSHSIAISIIIGAGSISRVSHRSIVDEIMFMDSVEKRHRRTQLTTIVMLLLALFSWGVQYKLSLYGDPAKSIGMPQAKLLSQKERPILLDRAGPEDSRLPDQPLLPFVYAFLASFAFLGLIGAPGTIVPRRTQEAAGCDQRPSLSFFFFRPPPVYTPSR